MPFGTRTINIALEQQRPRPETLRFTPVLTGAEDELLLEKEYRVTVPATGIGSILLPTRSSGTITYAYKIPTDVRGVYSEGTFNLAAGAAIGLEDLIAGSPPASDTFQDYVDANAVLYSRAQTLTNDEKLQARTNIGAGTGGSGSIDDLSDVVITAAASGDFVRHNGTNWVDSPIQAGDIPTAVDAAKIADGSISNAEFQRLNGVSSDIQTQLDGKQPLAAVLTATTASFTTADETKLDAIEALADVTDAGNVGSSIHGAAAKTTPVDADTMPLIDSAASNVLKKVTWANIKATLQALFDTLYATIGHNHNGTYQPLDADLTTIAGLTATTDNFIQSKSSAWASRTPAQVKTDLGLTDAVLGPASATDNALARFDSTTGKLIQNSSATLSDAGSIALPADQSLQVGAVVAIDRVQASNRTRIAANLNDDTELHGVDYIDQQIGSASRSYLTNFAKTLGSEVRRNWSSTSDATEAPDTGLERSAAGVVKVTNGAAGSGDLTVADEAYGAGWNGSLEVPTKNALFDKIETLGGGGAVDVSGTPTAGQFAVFVDANTVEGVAGVNIGTLTDKSALVDADKIITLDSEASGAPKSTTWTSIKAFLKTYLDTLYQPLDSDLTTIAGLTATTNNFIVSVASAWASRTPSQVLTTLGLSTSDSPQFAGINIGHASDTTLTRNAAGDIAVEGNLVYRAGGTDVPVADGGTGASTASGARTNLGLAIGTDVQAHDADLATIAGLTATTDNFIQSKSSAWASRTVAQVSADLQGTGLITDAIGFRTIPQNPQSAAYTIVAADSGKHILHPSADTTARIFTIPANSSVAFPVGTAITFVNQNAAGVITIAITTDTMRLAGAGTTGSRTLAANGVATAIKITSTEWIISGTGLT